MLTSGSIVTLSTLTVRRYRENPWKSARELDHDVQVAGVPSVLREHVEADPLQGGRVLGEPALGGADRVEGVRRQHVAGPLSDRLEPVGVLLGCRVLRNLPTTVDILVPGFIDVPVAPRLGD